jgi:beta-glucanase (GH16 family)
MRKYKLIITLFVFLMYNNVFAQLPFGDSAWVLQTSLSDEFTDSTLNTTKWNSAYWGGTSPSISNGAEINYSSNLLFNGSTLRIKADTLNPNVKRAWNTFPDYDYGDTLDSLTFAYQSGVIQARNVFKYGYFELSAKFPSKYYPLWPAFWLLSSDCAPGTDYLGELDIAENGALTTFNANQLSSWWHISDTTCIYKWALNDGGTNTVLSAGDSLSGTFHKYACQWDPDKFIFYFDDVPTFSVYDTSGHNIPQHNVTLLINMCIDPRAAYLPADWSGTALRDEFGNVIHGNMTPTKWPQYLESQYFRYYKLDAGDCSTVLNNLCNPSGYNRKIKKSITTDATCTPTFNPSTASGSYTLRATDFILINEGTSINPSGSGFFGIEILDCPQ